MGLDNFWVKPSKKPALYKGDVLPYSPLDEDLRKFGYFRGKKYDALVTCLTGEQGFLWVDDSCPLEQYSIQSTLASSCDYVYDQLLQPEGEVWFKQWLESSYDELSIDEDDRWDYDLEEVLSIILMFKHYVNREDRVLLTAWY